MNDIFEFKSSLECLKDALKHTDRTYNTKYQSNDGVFRMGYDIENSSDVFCIYHIKINKDIRNTGIFRGIIEYLLTQVNQFNVLAVSSYIMDKILTHYGFSNQGGDFICRKQDYYRNKND